MVTITQINNLRLTISDPADIIKITVIANTAALPATPTNQTAYYITATENYMSTTKKTGAVFADYEILELWLSNTVIGELIDEYGFNKALYKCFLLITAKIGSKLLIVKNAAGADSVEYVSLSSLLNYYNDLIKKFKEEEKVIDNNNTGRIGRTRYTRIAGGNL